MLRAVAPALALALVLAGCGATSSNDGDGQASEDQEAAEAEQRAAQQQRYSACVRVTKPLRDSLAQIDSRLDVGLSYDDYGDRLGDVQVAYDAVVPQLKGQGPRCFGVAVALENAFNAYNKVLNSWGDCIDDYYCDFSEGEVNKKAQAGWAKAGRALATSDRKLAAMKPSA
jgi:hypothetical protein